jgi:hypothetical protein
MPKKIADLYQVSTCCGYPVNTIKYDDVDVNTCRNCGKLCGTMFNKRVGDQRIAIMATK